jgi:hypothetical protein
MRCFTHHDKDAVAICRACGKGLCPECGADLGRGLACRGHCEQEARDYAELVDRSIQIHKRGVGAVSVIQSSREQPAKSDDRLTTTVTGHIQWTRRFRSSVAAFHLIVGMILGAWGLSDIEHFALPLVLGVCFTVYGVFSFMQARGTALTQTGTTKETHTA